MTCPRSCEAKSGPFPRNQVAISLEIVTAGAMLTTCLAHFGASAHMGKVDFSRWLVRDPQRPGQLRFSSSQFNQGDDQDVDSRAANMDGVEPIRRDRDRQSGVLGAVRAAKRQEPNDPD
jgi:hypothetical protein